MNFDEMCQEMNLELARIRDRFFDELAHFTSYVTLVECSRMLGVHVMTLQRIRTRKQKIIKFSELLNIKQRM